VEGLPYSLATRVGNPEGKTSPEELLAAAVGSCFAMSLAGELTQAGTPPERLDVSATCVVEAEGFRRTANEAEQACTMATLVRGSANVTVDATLEGGN
jgi:lipoyl-dependent peroxiredoxin